MPQIVHQYKTSQVARISGFSSRQLDYWAKTRLLVPSISESTGPGTRKLYSFDDLVRLQFIKQLRESGWSIQKIRKAIEQLDGFMNERPNYRNFRFISDKDSILVLCENAERQRILLDALKPGGQQVLWIVFDILRGETQKNADQLFNMSEFQNSGSTSTNKKKASS